MTQVIRAIKKMFADFGTKNRYWVGYSGGVDSQVLLHALAQLKPSACELGAIHIHHGLHAAADNWCEHCAEQAQLFNVPLKIIHVDAKPAKGMSPEAAARAARYAAFSTVMTPGDILLTAHNQNDQAETVFLQLIRGAGVKGLAAMPQHTIFHSGALHRPLLDVSRAAILAYASHNDLQWIEDPSNEDTHFDRNFLRQKIMPLLSERWPSITETVARSARHCAEASAIVDEVAREDFFHLCQIHDNSESQELAAQALANNAHYSGVGREFACQHESGSKVPSDNKIHTLAIAPLLLLTPMRQRQVLRYWIAQQHLPAPSSAHLDCLLRDVVHAAHDKVPLIHWPGADLRRFKGFLFAMPPLEPFDSSIKIEWDRSAPLTLPGNLGVIQPDDPRLKFDNGDLSTVSVQRESLAGGNLTVRFRRGGETMRVVGRQGEHELKKLMQEWGVLPWRRDRVPLIYFNNELVFVLLSPMDSIDCRGRGQVLTDD